MNLSSFKVHLGGIVVYIEGTGDIYEKIYERMSEFRKAEDEIDADITYSLVPLKFRKHSKDFDCCFMTRFFEIAVIRSNPSFVVFSPSLPLKDRLISLLPRYLQKIVYGFGIKRLYSINDLLTEAFFYEVFDGSSCFMLLKKGAAFTHASSVIDCIHNRAYVFAGMSGSGKSTIAAYLSLCCDYFRPLSDSRLIINKKGLASFSESIGLFRLQTLLSPQIKKAMQKDYSLSETILLRSLLALNQKEISKRLQLPENSGGTRSVNEAEIKLCFYLLRGKNERFTINKINAEDFAFRTSNNLFLTHNSLFGYMEKVYGEYLLWIKDEIKRIHVAAFTGAECFELCIPEDMAAADLGETVKGFITELRK